MGNLFGSVALHSLLIALLILATRNLPTAAPDHSEFPHEVEVTLELPQPEAPPKFSPTRKRAPLPSLVALTPKVLTKAFRSYGKDLGKGFGRGQSNLNSGEGLPFAGVDAGEAMAGTGGGAYPYLKYIRERLANAILYSEKLLDERRDGIIAFEITVDARGRILGDPRVAVSGDPELLNFTRREISRVMKIPVNRNVKLPGKQMTLTAQFDFRAVTREELKSPNIPTIVRTTLYIYPQAVRDPTFLYGGGTQGYDLSIRLDPVKAAKILKRTL